MTAKLDAEITAMTEIAALCAPVFDAGEAETIGEALRILATRGNGRAAACLAQIDGPAEREFWRDFALAVEADPYWTIHPDNSFECADGARYTTAEELVAAYRRDHAREDRMAR